jgi:hypothetical protein
MRQQPHIWQAARKTPGRRATLETGDPGFIVCSTTRHFSANWLRIQEAATSRGLILVM